jgi:TonB-linked SusC/RagA family outer membrane protein
MMFNFVLLLLPARLTAQQKAQKEENKVIIESIVTDQAGHPVTGAMVYGNEGSVVSKTDPSGKFLISVSGEPEILIEADGYEPAVFNAGSYKKLKALTLVPSLYRHGSKDDVNIAFRKVKSGSLVNAVSVVNPADFLPYANEQNILEALSGRVPGLYSSTNLRGIGTPLFIVDGLPRDYTYINLDEVEQITVLKDINSAILYGTKAVNGVVLVTTKRGVALKKQVNVSGNYGISIPSALPQYLSSADYMALNNEARQNDGLAQLYDPATIDNYRMGNKYRYPSTDYYSNEYLKSFKPFSRVTTDFSGGNNTLKYFIYMGWDEKGSLMNFGEGKTAKEDKFNFRGNVDMKINNWIRSSIDGVAVLDNNKGALGNFYAEAATRLPQLYAPLIPISLIMNPNANALLKSRKNDVDGKYLLGGTPSYLTNAFADGYSAGTSENIDRMLSFNNRIDFDLKALVDGLAFHTNLSFDFFTSYNQVVQNSYSVYTPTWDAANDSIVSLVQNGSDARSGNQNISGQYFQRRIGFYGLLDYDKTFGVHRVQGSLSGFGNQIATQNVVQPDKNLNFGLRLMYSYKDKYSADFSGALVKSGRLPEGNRSAFSPSLGLAWLISSENFMSAIPAVNYLKLKASAGILNTDAGITGYYYYDNIYGGASSYSWYDAAAYNGTISTIGGNPRLSFEKRKEINLGFESVLFDHKLSLDFNAFSSIYSNQMTRLNNSYPGYFANYVPYGNYNENSYRGVELGLSFNKSFGDLSFSVGANGLLMDNKVLKRDETWSQDYLYRKGRPVDALFGLVADGLFMDQNDINNHASQMFGIAKPGDIKYVDQNKDGIIDDNDQVQIGRSWAPFTYGLNMKISYKGLTLYALGNGSIGRDAYISNNYYWVDGNDKYSTYIVERWTEATKTTATLPRLSSQTNNNNHRVSTFWLYKDNFFTLNHMQLTWTIPGEAVQMSKMKNFSVYVYGSNLFTISRYRDIRELNVGSEPQYRSFSLGVKALF